MYNHLLYLLYWLVNAVVIFVFGWVAPDAVTLAMNKYDAPETAIYSGFWLTFFVWSMWDFVIVRQVKMEAATAFIYFLFVNFIGVWLISLYSKYTGMMTDWWWLFALALVANIAQRVARNTAIGQRT